MKHTVKAFACVALALACQLASARKVTTTVAVVVDPATYEQAKDAVDSYVNSASTKDRKGVLLIDRWGVPDSLRAEFIRMYREDNLEGAVLIGDIPIPMVRDAQHLCSAFKMDQRRPWLSSSVPSDRFYDDFGLTFTFLKKDAERDDIFYYSLNPDCDQKVRCNIYTARIRPARNDRKYEQIDKFLRKAVAARRENDPLDRALLFAGHGYNSESMNARMDEYHALKGQIPSLDVPGGRLDFIDHSFDEAVKYRLLSALSDEQLDLAVLHHHGAPDTEYMNGSPYTSSPDGWLRLARNYFRGKMASAKDKEATKKSYMDRYGIPEKWLDEYADSAFVVQDSIYSASMDLTIDDLKAVRTGVKMAVFDACFNGAFIEDDYIAANYIFNDGNATVVARAHSVNTLQDKWETELVGLLSRGVCAGNWARLDMDLDTHLFGDPLFCFGTRSTLDHDIAVQPTKFWAGKLTSDDAELRCLAVLMLSRADAISSDRLMSIQTTDKSCTVRLEAMLSQIASRSEHAVDAIIAGMQDNYELTQRLACKEGAKNLDPALTEPAVRLYSSPTASSRVKFQCKALLMGSDYDAVKSAFGKYPLWEGPEAQKAFLSSMERDKAEDAKDCDNLAAGAPDLRSGRLYVRAQRNGCGLEAIDPMFECYGKTSDQALKMLIAETAGWYSSSCRREYVKEKCSDLLAAETDPQLRRELQKTINRLR